jgi:hypothetical protein
MPFLSPDLRRISVPAAATLSPLWRKSLVLVPILLGAGVLAAVIELMPSPRMDPERLWLLHGMTIVKCVIGLVAARLIYWRLGQPITRPLAYGYSVCLAVCAIALGWLWAVYWFAVGAAFFWGGLFCILLVARVDPLIAAVKGEDASE